jgi:predicted DNA-binding protein (MmcQ/YjbR family)
MAKKKSLPTDKTVKELREWGLRTYPGAHLKSPWPGHMDLAVNDKTFAYLSVEGEPFGISCKLPTSSHVALLLPFCKPAAYGLGKSGWVSAQFPAGKALPVEMLKEWIDESYRAQAPKTLVKQLDGGAAPVKKPAKKVAAKKKK